MSEQTPGVAEYERLKQSYKRAVIDYYGYRPRSFGAEPIRATGAALDAYVAGLDAALRAAEQDTARLREQIEAERAVLAGKWILDSDHATEALRALERLPHVEQDAARLRGQLRADADAWDMEGYPENAKRTRAAIDAARKP
jgi:hypothetical protein